MDLVRAFLSLDGTDRFFFLPLFVHDTTLAIARSARFTKSKLAVMRWIVGIAGYERFV